MKVTFLVPNSAGPVLGPVTVLAKNLQSHCPVEIVAADLGAGLPPMYEGYFDYTLVPTPRIYRYPDYWWESRRLAAAVTGDVICAVKAYANTVSVALRLKRKIGKKVVVYLDEWDGALMRSRSRLQRLLFSLKNLHHPLEDNYYARVERRIPLADEVLSTTTFLQNKFGGRILHMGVDCDFFTPPSRDVTGQVRTQLGLAGRRLVVFGGVVRPHKGMETILEAMAVRADDDTRFLVVGPETDHLKALKQNPRYAPYIVAAGPKPKDEMPLYLSVADAIALPLVDNLLAQSQMPCKVFEAMAMAKPVVASAVSDLPLVLDGCGSVVPPNDPGSMAEAFSDIFSDPREAEARGQAAREKCLRLYSKEQTSRELGELVERLGS